MVAPPCGFYIDIIKIQLIYLDLIRIAAKCSRTLPGLFSPNLIDQSSCRLDLVLACVVRILHDDWLSSLGENRPYSVLKHLAAMLI